jgi:transcriptional repressor NF-X1
MPPVPCGTRIQCRHPCDRPPLECGHSRVPHACHEDPAPCPPCPFLTTKRCACGKKDVGNVRCAQEKVSCGTPCGKLLGCGGHRCARLCHAGECGPCTTVCGKPRKFWCVRPLSFLCVDVLTAARSFPEIHPCTAPCHAPSSCPETEPCMASVTLSCACGRIQQQAPCGRCTGSPARGAHGAARRAAGPPAGPPRRRGRDLSGRHAGVRAQRPQVPRARRAYA